MGEKIGSSASSVDSIQNKVLTMDNPQEIVDYLTQKFVKNPEYKIRIANQIKDSDLKQRVLKILSSEEVSEVLHASQHSRETLSNKVKKRDLVMKYIIDSYHPHNVRELLTSGDTSTWNHKIWQDIYQQLCEEDKVGSEQEKKNEANNILQLLKSENKGLKNIKLGKDKSVHDIAFGEEFSKQNENLKSHHEKYSLFGNDKLSIIENINEMETLDQKRKKFLLSLSDQIGNPYFQERYWKSCNMSEDFEDGENTPTCAAAINYNMKLGSLSPPIDPAGARNYAKGGEKKEEDWVPGDIVVYSIRKGKNGNDVGEHAGVFMGWENGNAMVWSENIGTQTNGYTGPFVHPINLLEVAGISDPKVYGLENFISQERRGVKFD